MHENLLTDLVSAGSDVTLTLCSLDATRLMFFPTSDGVKDFPLWSALGLNTPDRHECLGRVLVWRFWKNAYAGLSDWA